MDMQFQECDVCKAKPGSPPLCAGCLHNREVIDEYDKRRSRIAIAADPFVRVFRINAPWHSEDSDRNPVRAYMPGIWPTWGEFKKLIRLISGE